LHGRTYAPTGETAILALQRWRELHSDVDAVFDAEIQVDAGPVRPMVTWGINPQQVVSIDGTVPQLSATNARDEPEAYQRALAYMDLKAGQPLRGLAIDGAFIGACTNSRLSDLRRAAAVLKGRTVHAGVRAICVPGSSAVRRAAESEGLDRIFVSAGFEWRESGCSMCFYAGGESFGKKQRVVSSTNRNFESRQGPQTRTHLASPETVAASAIAGHLTDAADILT